MARAKGQRSPNYDRRRSELLSRMRERLGRQGAMRASWRELAAAAGVGLATLAHYFGKREDIVLAVMIDDRMRGDEPLTYLAQPVGDFATSIDEAVRHLANGFRFGGVGEIHALGLAEGLRHPVLGPGFVDAILEPGIAAATRRLTHHQHAGEMRPCDPRFAALDLIAPILVVFLHQFELGGANRFSIDIDAFLHQHADAFIRSYRTA